MTSIQTEEVIEQLQIVRFSKTHAPAFRELNLAWIRVHWEPETTDFEMLDNPLDKIVRPGGYIAIAKLRQEVVGTCALIKIDAQHYELAKMAVAPHAKGYGVGRRLGNTVIDEARSRGASCVSLDSNKVLTPAINLYRSLGFEEKKGPVSVYARSNIHMELKL